MAKKRTRPEVAAPVAADTHIDLASIQEIVEDLGVKNWGVTWNQSSKRWELFKISASVRSVARKTKAGWVAG